MSYLDEKQSWYEMLKEVVKETGDTLDCVIQNCTIDFEQLTTMFDSGYGGYEGVPFTAWGEKYVYFPIGYDGAESIGHAPRNPCDESMQHQGG
jgi:hypothetical protein